MFENMVRSIAPTSPPKKYTPRDLAQEAAGWAVSPLPRGWALLQDIIELLDIEVVPVAWDQLSFRALEAVADDTVAGGSPYPAFIYNEVLYISDKASYQAVCHELGHVAAWRSRGAPYDADVCNHGSLAEDEHPACAVEVYLMCQILDQDSDDYIYEHYNIGILLDYEPHVGVEQEELAESELAESELAESELAYAQWEEAQRYGKSILDQIAIHKKQRGT